MQIVTFRYAFTKFRRHQIATLQAILQMVDNPNKPGATENSINRLR
jgi:hypothetical protein